MFFPQKFFTGLFVGFLLLVSLLFTAAYADSPLTSTNFYSVYQDHPMVAKAASLGRLDDELAGFLSNDQNPIDLKAAVVNALSWSIGGKNNAFLYEKFLAKKYNLPAPQAPDKASDQMSGQAKSNKASKAVGFPLASLQPDEVFALGYLMAMDNYIEPKPAVGILKKAAKQQPDSLTVALVTALAQAQVAVEKNQGCQAWKNIQALTASDTSTFSEASAEKAGEKAQKKKALLKTDLRPQAVGLITTYMAQYQDTCSLLSGPGKSSKGGQPVKPVAITEASKIKKPKAAKKSDGLTLPDDKAVPPTAVEGLEDRLPPQKTSSEDKHAAKKSAPKNTKPEQKAAEQPAAITGQKKLAPKKLVQEQAQEKAKLKAQKAAEKAALKAQKAAEKAQQKAQQADEKAAKAQEASKTVSNQQQPPAKQPAQSGKPKGLVPLIQSKFKRSQ